MTTFIETKRLIIHESTEADLPYLTELMTDPDVMRYIGTGKTFNAKTIKDRLEKSVSHFQKHGFSIGCVFEKNTNEFVGRAGLIHLQWDDTNPEIEIGYSLLKKFWKKGYATELAQASLDWGFKNLPVEKLIGVTYPENIASRRVLEKIGMHYVGMTHCYGINAAKYEIYR